MFKMFFNKDQFKIFGAMLLIALVMFVSNYIVFMNSTELIYSQARDNNRLIVKSMVKSFDECFKEVNNIIYSINMMPHQIYDSNEHKNINLTSTFFFLTEAKKLMAQEYVKDFIICFPDSPMVVNSEGTGEFRSLFEQKYKNSTYAPDFWRNFVVTKHAMKFIPAAEYTERIPVVGGTNELRLLGVVGNNMMNSSKLNIFVFIDEKKLLENVNQQNMMKGSSLVVLDQDGNAIIDTGNDFDTMLWQELYFEEVKEMTKQKGKYEYNYVKSDYNDFIYISRTPYRYENILPVTRRNNIIMIATIFIAVSFSVFLSFYLYRPIKNIIRLVGLKGGSEAESDYKSICSGIEKMQTENKIYKDQLDIVEEEVRRSIFFRLVDDITSYKKLESQINKYFKVVFFCKKFAMISFKFEGMAVPAAKDPKEREAFIPDGIAQGIQERLDEYFEASSVFYMEGRLFIALVGLREQDERLKVIEYTENVIKDIKSSAEGNDNIIAALSRFYTQVQECKTAFKDIKLCFAFRNIKPSHFVIDAEKLEYTSKLYFPAEYIEKLSNCIVSGNKEESLLIINKIIDQNISDNINYIKFSNMVSSIFNSIINTLGLYGYDRVEILKLELEFFERIDSINSYIEIRKFLNSIIGWITDNINLKRKSKLNREYILEYINLHYPEDLCLESMAEVCGTSPKYFSNFFKKAVGINFVEYLNKARVYHAGEMLKNTDMPVAAIAERIGLPNPSTFAGVFKRFYGISPTEYRKDCRKV